mgnify:CR=1 FL=1
MKCWQKIVSVFVLTGSLFTGAALSGAAVCAASDNAVTSKAAVSSGSQTGTSELAKQAEVLFGCKKIALQNRSLCLDFAAEAAVLMNADTGEVLVARNENKRMHPASTTKMVTLLTALKLQGTRLDELATISPYAASMEESNLRGGKRQINCRCRLWRKA